MLSSNQFLRITSCTDGTSNTMMAAEVAGRPEQFRGVGVLTPFGGPSADPSTFSGNFWAGTGANIALDGSDFATGTPNTGCQSSSTDPTGIDLTKCTKIAGDCVINCSSSGEVYAFHTGGANFLFGDGSVHFLRQGMSTQTFAALATRAGGETIGDY
jgi:prepilin-type processing-associated H-X9-DG protein